MQAKLQKWLPESNTQMHAASVHGTEFFLQAIRVFVPT